MELYLDEKKVKRNTRDYDLLRSPLGKDHQQTPENQDDIKKREKV
jgi:hypothetical protein